MRCDSAHSEHRVPHKLVYNYWEPIITANQEEADAAVTTHRLSLNTVHAKSLNLSLVLMTAAFPAQNETPHQH